MAKEKLNTFEKLLDVLKFEKSEITSVYFYSILTGLVQLSLPLGIQSIISFVLGGAISTSLVVLIFAVIFGVFISGLLKVNQMKIIEKVQQQLFVRYSFQYAHTIPNLSLKEINNYYLPELVNRFFDTISLQKSISKILLDIPAATIQIIFGLILLSFYHPIFIFFGILLLVVLFLILRITASRGMQTSIEESNYKYKVAGYIQELARVILTMKFSRNSSLHISKTDEYVTGYLKARTSHFKILIFQYWTLITFKVLIVAAMLIIGSFLLVNQQLNIGQFIAAEMVILIVIDSVEKLIINLDKVYDVLTSIEKLTKVTDKPKEETGKKLLTDVEKGVAITLDSLSFGYTQEKKILHNISLNILPGERVCIMGKDNSGKSTLLKLFSGVFQDFEGTLQINNVPIGNYDLQSLRANTGMMLNFQDIFNGTIRENICVGNNSISDERLNNLAKIFGLKTYIDSHKEGYEYMLQPTGLHLSGKVMKKILLMRALIHDPAIVLLEEPWQGMEDESANNIKNYLTDKSFNKTVLVVTNDETFAASCDKVIILEEGKVKMNN
ncbi:MAG: ATP-binding cassette domain-containing protein [Taibaiella sp.]|nr:ATP-binding cassette domain-containing protein [Taibaiella sp.]